MMEAIATPLVIALGSMLTLAATRSYGARERWIIHASFAAHVVSAFAQVWITEDYYAGGGDMLGYFVFGSMIADVVRHDPSRFLPELWSLIVHAPSVWPFAVIGTGDSTGTMSGISGLIQLIWGESLHAVCLTMSTAAFFGQLALYRVFREVFEPRLWHPLAVAAMLVPSVVFWSSGILKETVVVAALGWLILGLHRFVQRNRFVGLALMLVAGFWIALVKAYVLFALAVSAGVWWYWRRSLEARGGRVVVVRPIYLVVGAGAVVGMIVGLGELFPRYALDRVGTETAFLQTMGTRVGGGSYYAISERAPSSIAGQLGFAPLALGTALFRPMLFEVRNMTMLVNALETTGFLALLMIGVLRKSWASLWAQMRQSPALMFAAVFVLTFGVAVGLTSTNMGTLSRYRVPMVPFFAAIVLVWSSRSASGRRAGVCEARPSSGGGVSGHSRPSRLHALPARPTLRSLRKG